MTDFPDDTDLLTLTVVREAGGEVTDGMAAVVRIIRNRARLRYQSDGTVRGTILHHAAFSEFGFDWINGTATTKGHYVPAPDAYMPERIAKMMAVSKAQKVWEKCASVVGSVMAGSYVGDAAYDHMTDDAVLYANLSMEHPAWAVPAKFVTCIGHQSFYRG